MKVMIINGSPNLKGNTSMLIDSLISGINQNITEVIKVNLCTMKRINHCMGCNKCKTDNEHMCIFDDGLNKVIAEGRKSDILVFASPIYFFSLNSLTKACMDRLFYSSEISNSENLLKGKRVAILLSYGLENVMESGAKNALQSIYDISRFVGLKVIGIVDGSFSAKETENETLLDSAKKLGIRISNEKTA
jgi:multimeric flavodoxin WrbA